MKGKILIKVITGLLIAAAVIMSLLYVREGFGKEIVYPKSSELTKDEVVINGVTYNNYYDSEGNLCIAGDKGYASYVKYCYDDGRTKREEYRDQYGELVLNRSQYAYLEITYEDNVTTYRYFDTDGNPAITNSGYSVVVKTKNSGGNEVTEMYYDSSMNLVMSKSGIYGLVRKYENKHNYETVYLDMNGNPMCSDSGYSISRRTYYENDKVDTETFYDAGGNKVQIDTGYYGVHYEYDDKDQRIRETYLDINNNPCMTSNGYASVAYTYNEDGKIDTERYFDVSGNPVRSGKSWYGIKYVDGREYCLSKNGHPFVSIEHIFKNYPYVVMLVGLVLCVLFLILPRKFNIALLFLYFAFILYQTLFLRHTTNPEPRFNLFDTYKSFMTSREMRLEIINNIWLFIPYGVGVKAVVKRKWIVYLLFLLPVLIESIQLIFGIGTFETDDIFNNCLGYLLGILLCVVFGKSDSKLNASH